MAGLERKDREKLLGTPLTKKQIDKREIPIETWGKKVEYSWSTGKAVSHFLRELKSGKITGLKCNECKRVMVPPRVFCEICFNEATEWVDAKNTGTVNTYCISYISTDRSTIKEPKIAAVIDIDGSNGGILHLLGEVRPDDVKIGMKVEAVWKPEWNRKGDITDIRYFKPAEED